MFIFILVFILERTYAGGYVIWKHIMALMLPSYGDFELCRTKKTLFIDKFVDFACSFSKYACTKFIAEIFRVKGYKCLC